MVRQPSSYLVVLGDRQALAWVVSSQQMAFSERRSKSALLVNPGDNLLLYTTRSCFRQQHRDRGRIVGQATVTSAVTALDAPVTFNGRTFPIGCSLDLHVLTPYRTGVELTDHVMQLHAFPRPKSWMMYLRRTLVPLDIHDYDLLLRALSEIGVEPTNVISEYVLYGTSRQPRLSSQNR
jgi:hypothetical protein